MITLYIGFDSSNHGQQVAFDVCKRSVLRFTNDINIVKLSKQNLKDKRIYLRDNDNDASTEFTYTRFLVPFLNSYDGYAIFCDSDFIWRCDINELKQYFDNSKAISCIQHKYDKCNSSLKMDGLKQEWYPRKNWSSLMIFNCSHPDCGNLTIDSIAHQTPQWLHRMVWTIDENIGSIMKTYNYLLGYYNDDDDPKVVHLTDGGPWHNDWYTNKIFKDTKYEIEWMRYLNDYEKDDLQSYLNK